jgi:type III pantothenate kinase
MLLVVDVGNTQTHFGTFDGERLVEHWRLATVREATADELGGVLLTLLELRGFALDDLKSSIVSSTVPQLEPEWTAMARRYLGHEMLTVGPGLRTGMAIRYDNPREIGADRLVNAVAIRERFGGPAICVDFGTAVNFDVISEQGEYVGGVAPPRGIIGKTTVDAIRAGVVYGFASAVDGIVRRLRDELGAEAHTIATGGLAEWIVPYCETIEQVDDLLTLTGLRLIFELNN